MFFKLRVMHVVDKVDIVISKNKSDPSEVLQCSRRMANTRVRFFVTRTL